MRHLKTYKIFEISGLQSKNWHQIVDNSKDKYYDLVLLLQDEIFDKYYIYEEKETREGKHWAFVGQPSLYSDRVKNSTWDGVVDYPHVTSSLVELRNVNHIMIYGIDSNISSSILDDLKKIEERVYEMTGGKMTTSFDDEYHYISIRIN